MSSLRERAREQSRRSRIAWAALATLLVVGPVVFTLARSAEFTVSAEIAPNAVGPYPPVFDAAVYRGFLADPELQSQMRLSVKAEPSEYLGATIRPTAVGTLALAIASERPAHARALINALGPQLSEASRRSLAARVHMDATRLRARLRAKGLSSAQRRVLGRQLRPLDRLDPPPPGALVLHLPAPQPKLSSWADRVADALPGEFPTRPSPIAAALAGLLIAAALWAVALTLPPRVRDERSSWARAP